MTIKQRPITAILALLVAGFTLSTFSPTLRYWTRRQFMSRFDLCSSCDGLVPAHDVFGSPRKADAIDALQRDLLLTASTACPIPRRNCSSSDTPAAACGAVHLARTELHEDTTRTQDRYDPVRLFGAGAPHALQLPTTGREVGLLVGPGGSIKTLDEATYHNLRPFVDVWAVNEMQFHPFIVPDYWHFEPQGKIIPSVGKPMQVLGGHAHPPRLLNEWQRSTVVICEQDCQILKDLEWTAKLQKRFYRRASINCDSPCKATNAQYYPEPGRVHVPCCSSINRVFDIMTRIGYSTILMLGFDGDNTYYYSDKSVVPYTPMLSRDLRLHHQVKDSTGDSIPKSDVHPVSLGGADAFVTAFAEFNGMNIIDLNPQHSNKFGPHHLSLDSLNLIILNCTFNSLITTNANSVAAWSD